MRTIDFVVAEIERFESKMAKMVAKIKLSQQPPHLLIPKSVGLYEMASKVCLRSFRTINLGVVEIFSFEIRRFVPRFDRFTNNWFGSLRDIPLS